ncbi:hypothetical protein PAXRUDRAFT_36223 [Paxillus rubicundulus Ve08.2h10]|uniref:Uncharacterized protein n=1 Tax=Paxillus rubicundulus Ve08.2h10 TaxID=930991 RepID=A0A0D0D991_9AGAM|nr:hypothetical protein PAXRUDRAFT_36223 [Paxillus rubicundulus Ve08.2h10]
MDLKPPRSFPLSHALPHLRLRLTAPSVSACYIASPSISQQVQLWTGNSNNLILLKGESDTEYLLCGVFNIAWNDFFFTADGNYDPANSYGSAFCDVKLNCRLTAPQSNNFQFAHNDFVACIENLRNLEELIKHKKNDQCISSIVEHLSTQPQFKLSHALFDPVKSSDANEPDDKSAQGDDDNASLVTQGTAEELGPEFVMETWPISEQCLPHLQELFEKAKRHVYSAILCHLRVLCAPAKLPSSPFKRARISAMTKTKGKSRAY